MCDSGVNELDVRSVLHGQVSLAAVNHICVIHEAMNGCKKSKGSLKDCFENVNIMERSGLSTLCLQICSTSLFAPWEIVHAFSVVC